MNLPIKLLVLVLALCGLGSVTGCSSAPEASPSATETPVGQSHPDCHATHVSPRPDGMKPDAAPVWMSARPGENFSAVWITTEQAQVLVERGQAQQKLPGVLADLERYRRGLAAWQSKPDATPDRAGNIGLCETRIRELEALRTQLQFQLGQLVAQSDEPENFLRASTR